MEFFQTLGLTFVPLFIAMDPLGVIPIFLGMTLNMDKKAVKRLTRQSIITAALVSVIFLFLGKLIFDMLGITISDFRIAGGLLLLIFAILDLISQDSERRKPKDDVGIVPIGIPLIMGPAALATIVILEREYNMWIVLLSLVINLLIIWIAFSNAFRIVKVIGKNGAMGIAKIIALLLAAYAVNMIRLGIEEWISTLYHIKL